jgi:hypothetical protein
MTLADIKDAPLIAELRSRGFVVHRPEAQRWMTVGELAASLGLRTSSLSRSISRAPKAAPPGLITERSVTGRILHCLPSPEFYAWLGAFPIQQNQNAKPQ